MTRVDLHPEDLFDRVRRGEASAQEAERVRAHLAGCPACKLEHLLARDCQEGAALSPGDDLAIARIRGSAARSLRLRGGGRLRGGKRRSPVTRVLLAAAALTVLLGSLTAGAALANRVFHVSLGRFVDPLLGAPPATNAASARPIAGAARADEPAAVAGGGSMELPALPPVEIDDRAARPAEPRDREETVRRAAPRAPALDRAKPAEPSISAGDLFARANQARRAGEAREAGRMYRELQTSFPGSAEELVSRVTYGRLLLDKLGDSRGALVQFDSYLANPAHGALREEALIGRALALGRLRRPAEERSAWAALLAAYPRSAYADRASARIEELR